MPSADEVLAHYENERRSALQEDPDKFSFALGVLEMARQNVLIPRQAKSLDDATAVLKEAQKAWNER